MIRRHRGRPFLQFRLNVIQHIVHCRQRLPLGLPDAQTCRRPSAASSAGSRARRSFSKAESASRPAQSKYRTPGSSLRLKSVSPLPYRLTASPSRLSCSKLNVLALNGKLHVAAIEGRRIGRAVREHLQHRDERRQLVDIPVDDMQLARAAAAFASSCPCPRRPACRKPCRSCPSARPAARSRTGPGSRRPSATIDLVARVVAAHAVRRSSPGCRRRRRPSSVAAADSAAYTPARRTSSATNRSTTARGHSSVACLCKSANRSPIRRPRTAVRPSLRPTSRIPPVMPRIGTPP